MKDQKYQIAEMPYYYTPDIQGRNRPEILSEIYDSVEKAENEISSWNNQVYILHHGEYSRPDYCILTVADAEYISSGRNFDMSNYDWNDAVCVCGECNNCLAEMIEQDRQFIYDRKID